MTLHLLRLPVDLNALARVGRDRGWTRGPRRAFDEGAALHHLLGETFGPAALQPFRLTVAPRAKKARLYAYSRSDPAALAETAAMAAMPEVLEALSPTALEHKPMPGPFEQGRRIGFDVRLRPTVRLSKDIAAPSDRQGGRAHGFGKNAEIDAFLAEALGRPDRAQMEADGRTREAVYRDWLARRLEGVAALEEVRLAAFRRTLSLRGGKGHEAPDIVMHGTLRVLDPEAFFEKLEKGIGRHRAYGFGMMLLRPPRPAPER